MLQGMEDAKKLFHILVADIGGTNANFGIIDLMQGEYKLLEYYKQPSQEIVNFSKTLQDLIEKIAAERHIRFSVIVIGVAGFLCGKQHSIKPTNLPFTLNKSDLMRVTGVSEIFIINDFISVACGYHLVENTFSINQIPIKQHGQKAFIGAGTGLGQSYAVWSNTFKEYIPMASEGGHTDFAPRDSFDHELVSFIQEKEIMTLPISWENVLSGKGLRYIYEFLGQNNRYRATEMSREIDQSGFKPDYISRYSEYDERCKQAFRYYLTYYARYAQQVALQAVACGGLYIAGGIAAKNKKMFQDNYFLIQFTNHTKHKTLLEKIPVFLIQDYQVSLYGGAYYYTLLSRGVL
ncbi:MAG: glucokinase [Candidatus Babeliaceae bacterium]|nr:glucokinase [Candidatus Babeliaceae bacterium]